MAKGWKSYRRRRARLSARELGLVLLLGLALGFSAPQWRQDWSREALEEALNRSRPLAEAGAEPYRVIDGDTFRYDGETIRIADIDTPETHAPRCREEAELGERATRRLDHLLAAGPFELEPIDRDEDRYGRKLRIVTRDGESLGDMLVEEGLARPYEGGRRPWCA